MNNKNTILIVDDEQIQLEIASEFFSEEGFECLTALDGVEAYATFLANQDRINVIISDKVMPKMTGIELLKKIKRLNRYWPLTYLVAANMDIQEKDNSEIEPTKLITKPFEFDSLIKMIKSDIESKTPVKD